jgi:hypothetical protein
MGNNITRTSIAVTLAVAAVACTGRTTAVGNDRKVQSGGNRGTLERVTLRGCVQPASTGQGFVLQHVVPNVPETQPQGQETMEHPIIARGSWVRLDGYPDIKRYLGNEVTVTGDVVDHGENTIGTSGQAKPMPRAGVANGDAPRVAIERVDKVADNCAGE